MAKVIDKVDIGGGRIRVKVACNRCRRPVLCSGPTNTCGCGTSYNISGQELAPVEQWGEETGESPADLELV